MRAKGPVGQGGLRRRRRRRRRRPSASRAARASRSPTSSATTENGGEYVFAVIERPGAPADRRPSRAARPSFPTGIEWAKSQRWGSGPTRFIRPVRWLLALFGDEVVPATLRRPDRRAHRRGATASWRRARSRSPPPTDYAAGALRDGKVVFDQEVRAALVRDGVGRATAASGAARAVVPEKTLAEVVNLVEWPTPAARHVRRGLPRGAARGARDRHDQAPALLPGRARRRQPRRRVRRRAQRRPGPHRRDRPRPRARHPRPPRRRGVLLPTRTWPRPHGALGRRGSDTIVFQEKLGTLAEKVDRIETLAGDPRASRPAPRPDETAARRPGGAPAQGRPRQPRRRRVPDAAGRHGPLLRAGRGRGPPRSRRPSSTTTGRASPATTFPRRRAGMLVAAADKLDTIAGIFAIGAAADRLVGPVRAAPRRHRRAGHGPRRRAGLRRSTTPIAAAVAGYDRVIARRQDRRRPRSPRRSSAFFAGRLEVMLRDRGNAYDIVAAVLAVARRRPGRRRTRAPRALTAFRGTRGRRRPARSPSSARANLARARPRAPSRTARSWARRSSRSSTRSTPPRPTSPRSCAEHRYDDALGIARASCAGRSTTFFDKVLVMDEDAALRDNRLRLLNRFVALVRRLRRLLAKLEG